MDERKTEYPYNAQASPQYPRPVAGMPQTGYPVYPQRTYPQQYSPAGVLDKDAQVLTQGGFKPLSKEEREEAQRIAIEAGFSFEGYQVVRREFFSHKFDPTLTIRGNSIIFNNACISKLEQVVYVQVLVNPTAEKLVIRPCEEGARDAIRWCIAKDDKRKSRQITCGLFTAKLYEMMGWEALYRYKLQGTRISYQGEQLYVFDLTSTEIYLPSVKDPDNPTAKAKRSTAVYPADWRDSFGIPVQEHRTSMQINLMDGYDFADVGQKPESQQMPMEMIDQETGEVTKV